MALGGLVSFVAGVAPAVGDSPLSPRPNAVSSGELVVSLVAGVAPAVGDPAPLSPGSNAVAPGPRELC